MPWIYREEPRWVWYSEFDVIHEKLADLNRRVTTLEHESKEDKEPNVP